ncbi:GDNF family receptor alpha-like [Centroberyx affinis]|uniref:GDNF family receptor alpha-like n=1 Tax=Centroberyx affinis TaxID=166261 RepID=UPI003A5C6974
MQPIRLGAAVIFGVVISQISSIRISSKSSDCLAVLDDCVSDLCKSEQAFGSCICEVNDEGCQIKGSKVCNMTIQTILDQFPSLQRCMCAWEEELCVSIQALATQCHQKPAQQKRSTSVTDWQSSSLIGYVYDGAGSCLKQMNVCLQDEICNRHLMLLHACSADQCNNTHCQQVTQHFYAGMPYNVAEMLVMCECESWDQGCLRMKSTLQSGTCGEEIWTCQDGLNRCLGDWHCSNVLKTFQTKCWEDTQCVDDDDRSDDCIGQMDPALILGGDFQCKMAFLATVGTALQHPCTCKGLYNEDLLKCNVLHDIFHNRSHFMIPWKSVGGPKPPQMNESEQGHKRGTDYLLIYAIAYVLLSGVALLMPMVVFYNIWMWRRRDKTKFHPPKKSNCVVIL